MFNAWFSTWDDEGNQGGFTIICASEDDAHDYFKKTCGEGVCLNDCGFFELEQSEIEILMKEYQDGIISKDYFTDEAFQILFE